MLHAALGRLRGASDAVLALVALALVALLVAPLPAGALDVLIAVNLAISATVLVVTLFARDALGFASFPTLLLLTTLFRLALNVSSTRLVLTRGDAGRVIEAFGRVVVQGDWVVGAVVFAILVLVQLLVIAKGAERVAEVAARFTLDALPGKQMSIDADLRAGLLDATEARRRRRALERESQLYGAMDGALKFVKGDAIAGLAIVAVNVVGGLATGLLRGAPLEAALTRYAVLAIGDGLASQIPALLIAVAAGVAVTRVAAEEEGGSLGDDVARQLLSDPRPLAAVAALLGALALAPGLPAPPFLALATGAGGAAWAIRRSAGRAREDPAREAIGAPPAGDDDAGPAALEIADDLLARLRAAPGDLSRALPARALEALWRDRGLRLGPLPLRAAMVAPGTWRLLIDEVPVASGALDLGRALCLAAHDELELAGIAFAPARDPASGALAALVAAADAERAAALGDVRDGWDRLAGEVSVALCRHAHVAVGVQEVQALLDTLEPSAPALVREVARLIPPATLAEVLRRLLEEGVSIRPLRTVLQAMLEAGGGARGASALAEVCRRALRRHIAHGCAPAGPLDALLLDPAAEARLREGLAGEVLAVSPSVLRSLLGSLEAELHAVPARTPVLLAAPEVRRPLRQLVAPRFPTLSVLSWEELPPELEVRPLGRVGVPDA
jgi:type III secretion protein V